MLVAKSDFQSMPCAGAPLSPPRGRGCPKGEGGDGSWLRRAVGKPWELPLNLVAADVRRLMTLNPKSEIDESLLTSAATVQGSNAGNFSEDRPWQTKKGHPLTPSLSPSEGERVPEG